MRIFSIAGHSNSGKTTLMVKIIQTITERGKKVVTIKSSKEDILPPIGSDTYKHMEAGASTTVFMGPTSSVIRYQHRILLKDLKTVDADFLLVEGMKTSTIPKIWCIEKIESDMEKPAPEIVAYAIRDLERGSVSSKESIEIVDQSDIETIIAIIERFSIDLQDLD